MTTQEFSDEFDVLLNSSFIENEFGEQSSKIDIQLDEYEKSVFLTQAQEQLVINLYNGRNIEGLSFESAEESRRYLKELTINVNPSVITLDPLDPAYTIYPNVYKVDSSAISNMLFITREVAKFDINQIINLKPWQTGNNLIVEVVPITQDEYNRTKRNPYKKFNEDRVLRIEFGNKWYLHSKYPILQYEVDFIRKPKPIIVSNLGDDITVDGMTFTERYTTNVNNTPTLITTNASELNPILHRTILLVAVKLAKIVKQNQIRNEMLGNMPGQLVHPPMQPVNQRPN